MSDGSVIWSEVVTNSCLAEEDAAVKVTTGHRASDGKPTLKWEKLSGAVSYEVHRSTSAGGTFTKVFTTAGTSYTHASATAGKTYYYKVKAVMSDGSVIWSKVVSNSCLVEEAATVEVTTGHRASDGKPNLQWNNIGAESYQVYRSTSKTGTYVKVFTTTGTSYTHVSATEGKTYYYQVKAILSNGSEVESEVVSNSY